MKVSINEVLLSIPLYQLTFVTPFPKEEIIYEQVVTHISDDQLDRPTLLVVEKNEDWQKLNDKEIANQLVQNINLHAILICNKMRNPLQEDILALYWECQIPIIQIEDPSLIGSFSQETLSRFYYSNLSVELAGFFKKGFMDIATNLAIVFDTPFLFLDENKHLLWQTGSDVDLKKCFQWLQTVQKDNTGKNSSAKNDFAQHPINIAGQIELSLITFASLADWQKKMIDKFIGFTAVLFQTDEVVREQNEKFKEFFIYELLYRKFESKKILINQGKTWGWNLEKSHHLLVVDVEQTDRTMNDIHSLDEIVFQLETKTTKGNEPLIIFPFQDQIVILVEDGENRSPSERKSVAGEVAAWIEQEITEFLPKCQMNIGIGKWYVDTIHLSKSYQEAKIALQFGKAWSENKRAYHMDDLGVLHLLTQIHRDILNKFCQEYLAPLINSDQEQGTEYLQTLKMYIQHQGVINEVADALYIHPNTLRKRMRRIESMIGFNFQNLEQLLNLMVAVKVYYSFSL